jgi:hypothetical protein
VCWRTQDVVSGTSLDESASVHDLHGRAKLGDDPEVVRDEYNGCLALARGLSQYVEYLGLRRHVKSRRRLVGDDEIRAICEGNRDQNPLTHTAGILVGVVVEPALRVWNFDVTKQFNGHLSSLSLGH